MRKFILIVFLLILPFKSFSYYLDSVKDFKVEFASQWEFECLVSSDHKMMFFNQQVIEGAPQPSLVYNMKPSELLEHYRRNSFSGVYLGLKKLAEINPSLIGFIEKNMMGKKLKWNCDISEPSYSSLAYANVKGVFFESDTVIDLLSENNFSVQGTAFHEFLHIAKVNNLSTLDHNSSLKRLFFPNAPPPQLIDDVIYACVAQAFEDTPLEIRKGRKAFVNSKSICEICTSARPNKSLNGVELSSEHHVLEEAKRACQNVEDKPFLFK